MKRKNFQVPGDIGQVIQPINLSEKELGKWMEQHLLKKFGLGALSFNKTKLKDYNWVSFYTVPPFIFSLNHHPDETISTFSLLVDCGTEEAVCKEMYRVLQLHFKDDDHVSYYTGTMPGDQLNVAGSAFAAITGSGSELQDASKMHTIHGQKQNIIINLDLKPFKKHQYFAVIKKFLSEYIRFVNKYCGDIQRHNIEALTAGSADDIAHTFFGNQNN